MRSDKTTQMFNERARTHTDTHTHAHRNNNKNKFPSVGLRAPTTHLPTNAAVIL